jgi:hypothetical protein
MVRRALMDRALLLLVLLLTSASVHLDGLDHIVKLILTNARRTLVHTVGLVLTQSSRTHAFALLDILDSTVRLMWMSVPRRHA